MQSSFQVVNVPQIPLQGIFQSIFNLFYAITSPTFQQQLQPWIYAGKFVGTYLSLVLAVGIIIVSRKLIDFEKTEALKEAAHQAELEQKSSPANPVSALAASNARKWQRVLDHIESQNPNDWRLAVLEADVLLDELLDTMHASGDTLGEKLKSLTTVEMPSLQAAWEAHLVRNRIAHDGGNFELPHREARRIVALYERVFRQGLYI